MPVTLKGTPELKARMNALGEVFKPAAAAWAAETVRLARINATPHSRTGRMLVGIRVSSTTKKRARVTARWPAIVVEGDTRPHLITAKPGKALRFQSAGRTIFARKANRRARIGTPFLRPAAEQALREDPVTPELIRLWNAAA